MQNRHSLVILVSAMAWAFSGNAPTSAQQTSENSLVEQVAQAIVEQSNQFRQQHELKSLKTNRHLQQAAKKFAGFMAETSQYGHQADGQTPAARAKEAGYEYCVVRENIAYRVNTGEVTAASLTEVFVQGWIDSSSHRDNLLAEYVSQTGVGVATEDGTTYYAVQLFGRPRSASIEIKVRNESNEIQSLQVETNDSVDHVDLPPHTVLSMTRCFPAQLSLADRDGQVIEVREATELTITNDGLQR